jgi:hypothetical protein
MGASRAQPVFTISTLSPRPANAGKPVADDQDALSLGSRRNAHFFRWIFGQSPLAMRRQVWSAVQPDRGVPSGSLPALRDANLIVTQEPATLQGDAFREFLTEHR